MLDLTIKLLTNHCTLQEVNGTNPKKLKIPQSVESGDEFTQDYCYSPGKPKPSVQSVLSIKQQQCSRC